MVNIQWAPQGPSCLEALPPGFLGGQNLYFSWFWGAHGRWCMVGSLACFNLQVIFGEMLLST